MKADGFGTVEALVATALFSTIAAGLASTVVLARRLETAVDLERKAVQVAVSSMERLRAGESPGSSEIMPGLVVTSQLQPWAGDGRMLEAHVHVAWRADGERSFHLRALMLR